MKMRKTIAALLAVIMAAGMLMLPGCAANTDRPADPEVTKAPADHDATEKPADPDATEKPGTPDPDGSQPSGFAIATPAEREYPVNPASALEGGEIDWDEYDRLYDIWMDAFSERRAAAANASEINGFTKALTGELIAENPGNNLVFSPANIYIALAMLAEVCDGDTRAEVLDVLGAADMASLRSGVSALLDAESFDDGKASCLLANSFWLNERIGYNTETLDRLAELYRAASFSGDPADGEYVLALKEWINENTKGLLRDSVDGIDLDPNTVLALVSTIYFKNSWSTTFPKDATRDDTFHAPDGDITCPFMHKTIDSGVYYRGSNYSAVWDSLGAGSGRMVFLLPDEGVSVEDMLSGGALDRFGTGERLSADPDEMNWRINFASPKLDVSSDLDLIPALQALGMESCFDGEKSDFTPLTTDADDIFVSQIKHAARVKTDEEGVEAAAFTLIVAEMNGMMMNEKTVEFTLDRPFAFVITGETGAPLFIGVVNDPME